LDLKVWRISKPEPGKAAANGTGAHRWNSPGAPIIYAAQSRALAALELLGHLEGRELFQESPRTREPVPFPFDSCLIKDTH